MFQRSMAAVNELESQFGALWTQCQRCQGSLHQVRRLPADRGPQTTTFWCYCRSTDGDGTLGSEPL